MTLLILGGHHRSGTSLLAQMFRKAGLDLGSVLLPGNQSNPHGHIEDTEVVAIHEKLLRDNGRNWQVVEDFVPVVNRDVWDAMAEFVARRQSGATLWGFKDPRVCLFVPLWRHVDPACKLVGIFRDPGSCISSLERREAMRIIQGASPRSDAWGVFQHADQALRMWLASNRGLLRAKRAYGDDVLLVRLSDVLDGLDVPGLVSERWGVDLCSVAPGGVVDRGALTSEESVAEVEDPSLLVAANRTWTCLNSAAEREGATTVGSASMRGSYDPK